MILRFIAFLIVMGIVAWLITLLPLPAPFPTIIWVAIVLAVIYEFLALFGVVPSAIYRYPSPPL